VPDRRRWNASDPSGSCREQERTAEPDGPPVFGAEPGRGTRSRLFVLGRHDASDQTSASARGKREKIDRGHVTFRRLVTPRSRTEAAVTSELHGRVLFEARALWTAETPKGGV